ncbi:kinase-like domain-containing protein [Xylogone sp. PMI_703]|nr:kinase-like domain-containing protein [Xylogone sp. PMI_703]
MGYIRGDRLKERWDLLSIDEKMDICYQLKKMVAALHQVGQPPYDQFIGTINHQGPSDSVFRSMPARGPFNSIKAFNDWISWLPRRFLPDDIQYEDPWRALLPDTGKITLTHGDLHHGNIIISRPNPFRILAIVDWGECGWYPDYWEYCKAARTSWYTNEWRNRWIPLFLEPRVEEHEGFGEYTMAIGAD